MRYPLFLPSPCGGGGPGDTAVRSPHLLLCALGFASAGVMSVAGMAAIPAQQVFRSGIDVVHLGVAVVDKAGSAVSTLTQDDFVVYEGGKKQDLKYFLR